MKTKSPLLRGHCLRISYAHRYLLVLVVATGLGAQDKRSTLSPKTAGSIEFACGGKFRFTARFSGQKAQDVEIVVSSNSYRLHRTHELGGRKFVDDSGHVIFVLDSTRMASLTRGDVLALDCRGRVPVQILDGREQ
jgi:hypothetical protein